MYLKFHKIHHSWDLVLHPHYILLSLLFTEIWFLICCFCRLNMFLEFLVILNILTPVYCIYIFCYNESGFKLDHVFIVSCGFIYFWMLGKFFQCSICIQYNCCNGYLIIRMPMMKRRWPSPSACHRFSCTMRLPWNHWMTFSHM